MSLRATICALALLASVAAGAASGKSDDSGLILLPGPNGTSRSMDVFRLSVRLSGHTLADEWTSPGTGDYSMRVGSTKYWFDRGDAIVDRRPESGGARALYHGYLRAVSSREFFFRPGAAIVRAYLAGVTPAIPDEPKTTFEASTDNGRSVLELGFRMPATGGGTSPMNFRITVAERITLAEARGRGLFTGKARPTSTTWESQPGAASRLGLAAYWLGRRLRRHAAVMVHEETRTGQLPPAYVVWYAAPAPGCPMRDFTAGKNDWWPGLDNDACDTWAITTWAAGTPIPFRGPRVRTPIRLADGTPAEAITVGRYIEMFVRTKRALIEIGANFLVDPDALHHRQLELARSLRLVRA
jgi:hypothetical protein